MGATTKDWGNKMKRINLAKYGFVRTTEGDFSDDGARFTAYTVGDVRVAKAKYEDWSFINVRPIYGRLPYVTNSKIRLLINSMV